MALAPLASSLAPRQCFLTRLFVFFAVVFGPKVARVMTVGGEEEVQLRGRGGIISVGIEK